MVFPAVPKLTFSMLAAAAFPPTAPICLNDFLSSFSGACLAFAEMLPNYAHFVKPGMFERASGLASPRRKYDVAGGGAGHDTQLRSRAWGSLQRACSIIDIELDWLDGKLADGRPYLAGERFSRADLAVASALAAFAQPKEMPTFYSMRAPERLAADVYRWGERPTMRWVREQYLPSYPGSWLWPPSLVQYRRQSDLQARHRHDR